MPSLRPELLVTGPVWGKAFNEEARALILWRDRYPGGGVPICCVCGQPIRQAPAVHHRQRRMPGNGRPSNGVAVHSRLEGDQCHHRRIHEDVATAQDNGWILPAALSPELFAAEPLKCAWRGWICLDDGGGWHAASSTGTRRL